MALTPAGSGYSTVAKVLHWLVAALLVGQFALGWLMPDIRRGMQPGAPMHAHISIGIVLLALIIVHVIAALVHAFFYRDRVLQRMLFVGRAPARAHRT